jgi:hypothetical protein
MSYELKPRRAGDGFWMMGTAGEDLGARSLVYLNASSEWMLADADAVATMPVIGLTIGAITSGRKGMIFFYGFIGDADWDWTLGNTIYASSTAGELTQTKPSTQEDPHIQSIAIPIEATLIMFNPALKSDLLNDVVMMNDNNWDDLRFPVGAIKIGAANPPDEQAYKGGLVLSYPSNQNRIAYVTAQMPHTWVEGTDIILHIHWVIPTSGAGGGAENVKWDTTYSWANQDEVFPAETSASVTVDVQNQVADIHTRTNLAIAVGIGREFSSMLIISIERDVGVGNDYADKAYLVEFDIHYKRNRLGTYSEDPP